MSYRNVSGLKRTGGHDMYMYPFVKSEYVALDVEKKKMLCANSYKVCSTINNWNSTIQQRTVELLKETFELFPFIYKDLARSFSEIQSVDAANVTPMSAIHSISNYLKQFYQIKESKLYLPAVTLDSPR